jgi:hypothetical protein
LAPDFTLCGSRLTLAAILCRFLQKRQGFAAYNLDIGGVRQTFRVNAAKICLFFAVYGKNLPLAISNAAKSGNRPAMLCRCKAQQRHEYPKKVAVTLR